MMCRALLFDLFDTLIHIGPMGYRAESIRLALEAGIREDRWIAAWRSTAEAAMLGEIGSLEERVTCALLAAGMASPPATLVRALVAARQPGGVYAPRARLYEDVKAGLALLRRRSVKTALLSNIFSYETEIVDRLGLPALLDALVLSCQVGICKPDPRIYLEAAERLSVNPSECVFVGDGMNRELSGARAVGMTAVRIERSDRDEEEERDDVYDARVSTLAELADWIRAR